jgi:hypothetical protein
MALVIEPSGARGNRHHWLPVAFIGRSSAETAGRRREVRCRLDGDEILYAFMADPAGVGVGAPPSAVWVSKSERTVAFVGNFGGLLQHAVTDQQACSAWLAPAQSAFR